MFALITNDDGIQAPGVAALETAARRVFDEVAVVAPRGQMSAVSHAITLRRSFRVERFNEHRYSVEASPADCVFFAVRELFRDRKPDVVLSGVNQGPNLGYDTLYSGTVAGAREGVMQGIPALSFSVAVLKDPPFEQAVGPVEAVLRNFVRTGLPVDTMANVNIPSFERHGAPKGFRVCTLGRRVFENRTALWTDPTQGLHGWIGGRDFTLDGDEDSDCAWIDQGYVTLSLLTWNLACANMAPLTEWSPSQT